jgi:DNA (cytosine-5)-methyltransferase 1
MGYYKAFGPDTYILGIDIRPQPHYPFDFQRGDFLDFLRYPAALEFDFYHVSPPCQRWSAITKTAGTQELHPDLITPTRIALQSFNKPYVIENVVGAPLENPLTLCGTMFGLLVVRHRLFETKPTIWWPPRPCQHERKVVNHGRPPDRETQYHGISGHFSDMEFAYTAMGINWKMTQKEMAEAIPPAYTKWIGEKMLEMGVFKSCGC